MLIRADARALPLGAACVQCVVTSPPYFGLRDYGNTSQIGLEGTPDAYVASLVQVFREVRRVLKDDGIVWLNIGDSYAAQRGGTQMPAETLAGGVGGDSDNLAAFRGRRRHDDLDAVARAAGTSDPSRLAHRDASAIGLKHKDLIGIPWRVAFALQADGWYLRSDIIWAKPNPMPESVTDRPTKAHEYLFLLAKSERYYYDADAIKEAVSDAMLMQVEQGYDGLGLKNYEAAGVQNPSSVKARIIANARQRSATWAERKASGATSGNRAVGSVEHKTVHGVGVTHTIGSGITRNKRSVWTIPTMPYAGAHFATMPEALVEPCILAGCPLGGLVLDPFLGSGTVGAVAERLGRRWVGTDLSYQPLAQKRTQQRGIRFDVA